MMRYLGNSVGRSAEFQADQRVVRMGYGRQLSAALKKTVGPRDVSSSHPPARTRIARIEASLRPGNWKHPSIGLK
jgi:heat shock protein HtpX/STE24 endopeptidase